MNTPIITPSRTAAALRNLVRKITGSATAAEVPHQPHPSHKSYSSHSVHSATRIGKIARLPEPIRSELNHRLRNGQPAHKILPWLNALPEVQQVLAEHFKGKPIHKVNLTHWRNGGFQDDQQRHRELEQLKELTAFTLQLSETGHQHLSNGTLTLANLKMLQHLRAMQNELDLAELHKIIRSAATIRRAEISLERSQTAKGMLRCRKRLTRVAERKLKHQIRQDRRNYHAPETLHPNTMTFEEVLDAALQPPPDYKANEEAASFSESAPLVPCKATNTEDGRARSPSAPHNEVPAPTSAESESVCAATNAASPSSSGSQFGALDGPNRTGQDTPPATVPPAAPTGERQQSYWANPISMSNQPPTPLPVEPKPAPAQPLPPNRLTPELEAELNLVKADQERCRAKYRASQLITQWSPQNWQTQRVINRA